ncbi:BTB/POZ domain and ankyrin repeat-containing protein NPR1-like [Papaver somniferum]|uniref:BTB/POZ domain and ankyrin repeat-containing protein NPR1-like n=1 Tax=Papaver somniferum TaxID=3469 RepID=UPI000E6FC112|nr:BTB/POZ domain and ankyrin repeat-containing protein NPR1-like [Papaver somniferum]
MESPFNDIFIHNLHEFAPMNSVSVLSDSNSGATSCMSNEGTFSQETAPPFVTALTRLSENLESVFETSQFSDAVIVASDTREIPIHRCILSGRSVFFKNLFSSVKGNDGKVVLKDVAKDFKLGFDSLNLVLAYLYSGKVKTLPVDVCVCVDEECLHVGCRPVVDFMVEVLYASFTFQISELVTLFQRRLLDIIKKVGVDDILVILSVANLCGRACEKLAMACIEIVVPSDVDLVTLEKALPPCAVKQIMDKRILGSGSPDSKTNDFPDKHARTMFKALDSDDVELVGLLLKGGKTSLDEANALHYAVAYCDAKITKELLEMGIADVNLRNQRGYTVLHVAAMRREPEIIASIITKGARLNDVAPRGRKALQILKRLTKLVEYQRCIEKGENAPKDRLCIEILEQAETEAPLVGDASYSLATAGEDHRQKWSDLENRVAMARLLFPKEAQVAMHIAKVDGTKEFPLTVNCGSLPGHRIALSNLNEAPFMMEDAHHKRITALLKTVEFGKRFFPRCSKALDKIVDDEDLIDLAYLGNDMENPESQLRKRRYIEIVEDLKISFRQDKVDLEKSRANSPSSSTKGLSQTNGKVKFRKRT